MVKLRAVRHNRPALFAFLKGSEMNGHLFNDDGASLVEYALVLALIALVCIAAMTYFGGSTALSLSRSGSLLSGAGS